MFMHMPKRTRRCNEYKGFLQATVKKRRVLRNSMACIGC